MNNLKLPLQRDGKVQYAVIRADLAKPVGSKFKWGSGKCWTVVAAVAA